FASAGRNAVSATPEPINARRDSMGTPPWGRMIPISAMRDVVEPWFRGLRDRICARLEQLDGTARFKRTSWQRPGGGGGEMSEIRGDLFEKGGCNFSAVAGERYPGVPEGRVSEEDEALGIRPPRAEEIAGKPFF